MIMFKLIFIFTSGATLQYLQYYFTAIQAPFVSNQQLIV